jgi:hypothetical protein
MGFSWSRVVQALRNTILHDNDQKYNSNIRNVYEFQI